MATENNITEAWKRYEDGRNYNNNLTPNQYRVVNTNTEFYAGNQWVHLPETASMARLPKPTFNIIKRITQLFVSSLASSASTIKYEPLSYYDGQNLGDPDSNAAVMATAAVKNLFEKFKMDYRLREALTDGAVSGDYAAHFYFDADALPYGGAFGPYRGEIQMELVDGLNVMFGNPNTTDVQSQPYILIVGRDTVGALKEEAERVRKNKLYTPKEKIEGEIIPDSENWDFQGVGGKVEITPDDDNGKCLYVYMYTKELVEEEVIDPKTGMPRQEPVTDKNGDPVQLKDKTTGLPVFDALGTPVYKTQVMKHLVPHVHVTKATRSCVIYEDVDTGLTNYPIAWGNWEKQKNQYHGRALVTGIIPNQIYINTMFAMVMRHLQLLGFPKVVYNADYIRRWNNDVGEAIGVRGLPPGQGMSQVAYALQPADMSNQIILTIDKAMQYTRDCLGATDVQMGTAKADNTSAIMVLQSASEIPLENVRAGVYEWLEDIGVILLDMMGTYYGDRPLIREREFQEPVIDPNTGVPAIDPMTGQMQMQTYMRKVAEDFDFSQFKYLYLNCGIDAGASTYYSEVAMVQTLDNLRMDGTLDIIDYLERVPDKLIPRKQELIDKLKQQQGIPTAPEGGQNGGVPNVTSNNPFAQGAMGITGAIAAGNAPASALDGKPNADVIATPSKTRAKNPTRTVSGSLADANMIDQMPGAMQGRFGNLPKKAQNAVMQMSKRDQ